MSKYKIYCDMDGVLCDFVKGIEKLHGININNWSYGSKTEKWAKVKATPKFCAQSGKAVYNKW